MSAGWVFMGRMSPRVAARRATDRSQRDSAQGQEFSSVVFFRAFVMLACLIVVPLAAIFGSAFPEVVKSVVDRCIGSGSAKSDSGSGGLASFFDRGASSTPAPPAATAEMAPRWQGSPAMPPAAGPAWGSGSTMAAGIPSPGMPPDRMPGNTASLVSAVGPPNGQWPDNQVRQAAATDAAGDRPPASAEPSYSIPEMSRQMPSAMPPANMSAPPGQSPPATQFPAAAQSPPPSTAFPDRFKTLERKLKEYGATYYLLETWGAEGEQYRFHCKIAVGNNPNCTQRFEATDRDAMRAMARVVEQVEAARASRTQ
jgi:hypothetical protein